MKTKNISESVILDAMNVCDSICIMNTPHSVGYGFNYNEDNTKVWDGMFLGTLGWDLEQKETYDGYIDFKDKTLTDRMSGEVIKLKELIKQ
jgi:hypothetical protein